MLKRLYADLGMKLSSLRSYDFSGSPLATVQAIVQKLNEHPDFPGVLILQDGTCVGMVSRARCFEFLSRPFAREIYLKTSLADFSAQVGIQPLVLPDELRVDQAVQTALSRPPEQVYDPIVIHSGEQGFRLVDMHDLLMAQSELLRDANRRIEKQVAFEQKLSNTLESEEVFDLTLGNLADILPHDQAAILLLVDHQLNLAAKRGFSETISPEELSASLVRLVNQAECMQSREATLVAGSLHLDDRDAGNAHALPVSWLTVPLIHAESVIGFLVLGRRIIPGQWGSPANPADPHSAHSTFTPGDLALLSSFTNAITAAIRNAQLHSQVEMLAITDWLTNIHNRRGFFERAQRQVDRSRQSSRALCAMMIDIDHFKLVNDAFGHLVGDQVIRIVAETCHKGLRELDLLGRFGGEEFMILLPDCHEALALRVAERLRASIADIGVTTERGRVSVTASIGVAEYDPPRDSLDTLLQRADEAMYAAKLSGRNRVILWEESVPGSNQTLSGLKADQEISPFEERSKTMLAESIESIGKAYDEMIESWTHALELRDLETEGHSQRVTDLTLRLARRTGYPEKDLVQLRRGALLHDIGKIAIPDDILLKPGKLTPEEWEIMKMHPQYARDLLLSIHALRDSLEIPYCHHERWDGNGYPRGLKGAEIPLAARLFAVIDVWDALNSDRCYRPAWKKSEARTYIEDQSGKQFDPEVVGAFLGLLDDMGLAGDISTEKAMEPIPWNTALLAAPRATPTSCG
jgi:diguanylate cyclase (GGDEF)-like protein